MSTKQRKYWNLTNVQGLKNILKSKQTRPDEPLVIIAKQRESKDLEGFIVHPDNESELIDWANKYIPTGGWKDSLDSVDISPVSAHPKQLLAEVFPDKVSTIPSDIKHPEPLTPEEEKKADTVTYNSKSEEEFEKGWSGATFFTEDKYTHLAPGVDPLDISDLEK